MLGSRRNLLRGLLAGGGAILAAFGGGKASAAEIPPATGHRMIRRVVTANTADGKSYIASNELVPASGELWASLEGGPLGKLWANEPSKWLPSTAPQVDPPLEGSGWRFAPVPSWSKMEAYFGAGRVPGHDKGGFHRTSTIDYVQIFEGEVQLLLDQGSVVLQPGDVVVQRNTLHSWRNLTESPASMLAVLVRLPAR